MNIRQNYYFHSIPPFSSVDVSNIAQFTGLIGNIGSSIYTVSSSTISSSSSLYNSSSWTSILGSIPALSLMAIALSNSIVSFMESNGSLLKSCLENIASNVVALIPSWDSPN